MVPDLPHIKELFAATCLIFAPFAVCKDQQIDPSVEWREYMDKLVRIVATDTLPTAARKVDIFTIDTRPWVPKNHYMPGVLRRTVLNNGAIMGRHVEQGNVRWRWGDKPALFGKLLRGFASWNPNRIVVMADSLDVIFGGCTEEQMLHTYNTIVAASGGAPVVMAAEFYCFGLGFKCSLYRNFTNRRQSVLKAYRLPDDVYSAFSACPPAPKRGEHDIQYAFCSSPQRYQYVNSGFMMGPARDVHRAMIYWKNLHTEADDLAAGDQASAHRLVLAHPDLVTLDYTGRLVLTVGGLFDVVNGVLKVNSSLIYNREVRRVQCFIHGNGPNGKGDLLQLLRMLPQPQ